MSDTPENFIDRLNMRPQMCACKFEWREMPDLSGVKPKQLEECGFHSTQRNRLERENADLRLRIASRDVSIDTINHVLKECADALGREVSLIELPGELAELRAKLEEARKDAQAMKAATYSHVDGRDLLHELQPNGAHHIDILVRINGQDRRYQGDWLKTLTWARDGHNMGEYADNPRLRAMIESRRAASPDAQEGMTGSGIDAAIAAGKGEK